MWGDFLRNRSRKERIKQDQDKLKLEREKEHENQIILRKKNAQSKLQHYLSSKFANECARIIQKKIDTKELLLNDLQFEIKRDGIYYEYGRYGLISNSHLLIKFQNYGYNDFSSEIEQDSFSLAICSMLGMIFEIVYYIPYDREYDWNRTYIISKSKSTYKDI